MSSNLDNRKSNNKSPDIELKIIKDNNPMENKDTGIFESLVAKNDTKLATNKESNIGLDLLVNQHKRKNVT